MIRDIIKKEKRNRVSKEKSLKTIIPKIRVKNFLEAWTRKKLQSLAPLRGGFAFKSEKFQNVGIPIVRISNIGFDGTVGGEFEYYSKLNPDEKFVLKGRSLLLAMSGATTGKIAMLDSEEEYYQNQRVGYFQNNGAVDYDFLSSVLQTKAFTNQLNAVLVAGAQPNISSKEIDSFEFCIPESIEEQSAIGTLFRTLDDLLGSYKDNLANYQSLKATMLFKLFPKAGQTVPEIRFDGFEGEWELLEINDLADDFQSGGTPKTNVQEYWDGEIPWIQSSDLETDCLFEIKVQKSISEKGLKKSSAKIIPKDSIAVVTRVGVGKLAVMRHEYATSQDFLSLSNLKSNIEFTAYLLYRLLQKEVTQLQGTSIKGITKVELLSEKVLIQSLSEQQAIGPYFSNLDNLIAAHQEKISQLETLKKKLLQDMFI